MPYYSAENGDYGDVRLNGNVMTHVICCDTDKGWVEYAPTPMTVSGGKLVTQVLQGHVEFIRYQTDTQYAS